MRIAAGIITVFMCLPGLSQAAIQYDGARNCLWVSDYPREWPCTMERLLSVDRMNDWGRVSYDRAADTYTIECDLWIGKDDGSYTYFQVGTREHPRETVILKGNLVIYPNRLNDNGPDGKFSPALKKVNRLRLGNPDDKSISATFKIDDNAKTINIGTLPEYGGQGRQDGKGGRLHIYNSWFGGLASRAMGAGATGNKHYWQGESFIFKNATIAWLDGMPYGADGGNVEIMEDSVFDGCGAVFCGSTQRALRCTFKNCDVVVLDRGSADAQLTDCVFKGNNRNWYLSCSDAGVLCLDCAWDAPKECDKIYRSGFARGKGYFPKFISRRHIVVEVVDKAGQPIPGALVEIVCEQADSRTIDNVINGVAQKMNSRTITCNNLGRTPRKEENGAVLLTEMIQKATDIPEQPEVKRFSYKIRADAKGFLSNSIENFHPQKSREKVRLVLSNKKD